VRLRLAVWPLLLVLVVLAARTVVYALAPQSLLLAALAHNEVGPDVTVPLVVGVLVAAAFAVACLGLAALAVRERLLLEGRALVVTPRLRPGLLAGRALGLFSVSAFAFAMLESYLHWRAGLGWHGINCLVGPVHRDAIPVLAALSLAAVAVHAAVEHLLAWARRLVAQLAATLAWPSGFGPGPFTLRLPRPQPALAAGGARAPPAARRP
jgi:hypothetical protein